MNITKMTQNRTETSCRPESNCKLQNDLYIYILPIIVITGSVGNVATLIVFRREKFRKMSVGIYMIAYSVINLLDLFLIFGQSWFVDALSVKSIDSLAEWTCKVWNFVYRVLSYSCVWLIVALTVDRFICVCHSIDAKRLCTVFLAKITVVFIIVGLTVVSVHAMWSYENFDGKCIIYPFGDVHIEIWRWVSMSSYCFIPFTTLVLLNIRIVFGLARKLRNKKLSKPRHTFTFTGATLAISFMYLLLHLPATITNIIEYSDGQSHLSIERAISDFLSCGSPTVFFFMCLLFSRTFRTELYLCLRKEPKKNKPKIIDMSNLNKYEYIECASETFV